MSCGISWGMSWGGKLKKVSETTMVKRRQVRHQLRLKLWYYCGPLEKQLTIVLADALVSRLQEQLSCHVKFRIILSIKKEMELI